MMMGGNQNPINNHETVEEVFCHGFLLATFQMSVGFRKGHWAMVDMIGIPHVDFEFA